MICDEPGAYMGEGADEGQYAIIARDCMLNNVKSVHSYLLRRCACLRSNELLEVADRIVWRALDSDCRVRRSREGERIVREK